MLGSSLKHWTNRQIICRPIQNSGQQPVTSAECAHDAVWTDESARLFRRDITRVHVNTVKLQILNKISPIVENQLHLFRRHSCAQSCGIRHNLRV